MTGLTFQGYWQELQGDEIFVYRIFRDGQKDRIDETLITKIPSQYYLSKKELIKHLSGWEVLNKNVVGERK